MSGKNSSLHLVKTMHPGSSTFSLQFETVGPQETNQMPLAPETLGVFKGSSQIPLESSLIQIQYPQFF